MGYEKLPARFALFYDWTALCQKEKAADGSVLVERSADEEEAFSHALGRMQFAIRYELEELDGGGKTRLRLSAEMLGASEVEKNDVEDVNQVMRQIEEIFNANAENLKAMAEGRKRVHPYKMDGYLCE